MLQAKCAALSTHTYTAIYSGLLNYSGIQALALDYFTLFLHWDNALPLLQEYT